MSSSPPQSVKPPSNQNPAYAPGIPLRLIDTEGPCQLVLLTRKARVNSSYWHGWSMSAHHIDTEASVAIKSPKISWRLVRRYEGVCMSQDEWLMPRKKKKIDPAHPKKRQRCKTPSSFLPWIIPEGRVWISNWWLSPPPLSPYRYIFQKEGGRCKKETADT